MHISEWHARWARQGRCDPPVLTIRRGRTRRRFAIALLAALVAALLLRADATSLVPLTLEETVREADGVFVGTCAGLAAVPGEPATEAVFEVEEVLAPSASLPGGLRAGGRASLKFWGGTVGGRTVYVAGAPLPVVGETYIVMLHEDQTVLRATPFAGFKEGALGVKKTDGRRMVLLADGTPLSFDSGSGRLGKPGEIGGQPADVDQFKSWFNGNVKRIRSLPKRSLSEKYGQLLPGEILDLSKLRQARDFNAASASQAGRSRRRRHQKNRRAPQPAATSAKPNVSPSPYKKPNITIAYSGAVVQTHVRQSSALTPNYAYVGGKRMPPLTMNLMDSWEKFYPADMEMTDEWGETFENTFFYHAFWDGNRTVGWQNGMDDFVGLISSADLKKGWGVAWSDNMLATTLLVIDNVTREIIEADVVVNPNFPWTLDEKAVFAGRGVSFRQTALHEVGHVIGLDHSYTATSIMNVYQRALGAYPFKFLDDMMAHRNRFPDWTPKNVKDMGGYFFHAQGTKNFVEPKFPASVVAGDAFIVQNILLENVGVQTIRDPQIDFYLVRNLDFKGRNFFLGTVTLRGTTLTKDQFLDPAKLNLQMNVFDFVDAGEYYLAMVHSDGGYVEFPSYLDFNTKPNNFAFSRTKIRVIPALYAIVAGGVVEMGSRLDVGAALSSKSDGNVTVRIVGDGQLIPVTKLKIGRGKTGDATTIRVGRGRGDKIVTLKGSLAGITETTRVYVKDPKVKTGTTLKITKLSVGAGYTLSIGATLNTVKGPMPIQGFRVSISINGKVVGTPKTDETGVATVKHKLTAAEAAQTIVMQARYAGKKGWNAASHTVNAVIRGRNGAGFDIEYTNADGGNL